MFGIHSFVLFIASGLLLNITPGAGILYIVSRSATLGTRAGVLAAFGVATGLAIHAAFAVAGLSAILATSALAFTVVKYVGAAYLLYLGVKLLFKYDGAANHISSSAKASSLLQVYKQGVLVNFLNPKIALFFLAFFPQFIDKSSNQRSLAFLALGMVFTFNGTCVNMLIAWLSAALRQTMAGSRLFGCWLRILVGSLFVGLGIKLAVSAR